MGWLPDLPDVRDYSFRHPAVLRLLKKFKRARRLELPEKVDLRRDGDGEYFTETEEQGTLNSSTAFAVLSLIEYFERRIHGRTFESSKLFLYKVTRNRIARGQRVLGDMGADLRTTLKVLVHFGTPPEEHWPYVASKFDEEPSAFHYGLSDPVTKLLYFRLDEPNVSGEATLGIVKSFLAAGFPVVFGFPVPSSLTAEPNIPYRPGFDSVRGGQAVVAVGYTNNFFGHKQDALLIRSSWGSKWGDNGNGWLPVAYFRNKLARDCWTVVSEDDNWPKTIDLSRPTIVDLLKQGGRKNGHA